MISTRSGEVLSAATLIALALSTYFSSEAAEVFKITYEAPAIGAWMLFMAGCGFFCLVAAWTKSEYVRGVSRFISGCVWGTVIFLLSGLPVLLPLFWMAVVLLSFDIFTVITKGQLWIQLKSHS